MHFGKGGRGSMEVSSVSRCLMVFWRSIDLINFYR